MIKRVSLALLLVLCPPAMTFAQAPLCVPPEEPWAPESNADFRTYADLVAGALRYLASADEKL